MSQIKAEIRLRINVTHWSNLRSQTHNSPHQRDLHFLMRKDLYFHVGYATKIKSSASHNILGSTEFDFCGIAHVKVEVFPHQKM